MPDDPTPQPSEWADVLKGSAAFKDLTEDKGASARFYDNYFDYDDLGPAHQRRLYGLVTAVLPTYRVSRGGLTRGGKQRIRVT